MKNVIVADIDGCILNSEHRLHHLLSGDVPSWHEKNGEDTVIPQGIAVYSHFMYSGLYDFIFVTGRMEEARSYTEERIRQIFDKKFPVLMRPAGDISHDTHLKPRLVLESGRKLEDIFLAFDDRNSMVEAWRKLGVVCYQTQEGDF